MRYYFHLEKGTSVQLDHRGREFPDIGTVKTHATAVARELAKHEKWTGWSLLVIGSNNSEVLRVPIANPILAE
jgi:hypothetical protein